MPNPVQPRNPGVDRRVADRWPVSLTADYRRSGRPPFKILITDLSQTGCQCETVARAHVGDHIWLTIGTMAPLEAAIRWATPFGFGCEWVHPLHISLLDHIRTVYPQLA